MYFALFSDLLRGIFGGRKKICHSYKCAECTQNYHCPSNQYCSGYSCTTPTTEDPFWYTTTTSKPFYGSSGRSNSGGGGSFSLPQVKIPPVKLFGFDNIRFVKKK